MTRARLLTSIPFWILLIGSLAAAVVGLWIILGTLPAMEAGLDDGSATTAQVYGGQSWTVVGAAVLGAGVVGIALALAVGAVSSIIARPSVEVVEVVEDGIDDEPIAFAHDEPVLAQPVTEDPDVETSTDQPAPPQR